VTRLHSSGPPPSTMRGKIVDSEVQPGVRYLLERHVGEGGMGMAYLARRESPEGVSPVVVKVVLPKLGAEISPDLVAQKEAVALGRLNERVPVCPFVVRFVDTGRAPLFSTRPTPWIAIEYVHGGIEGTTLEDRVTYSIHKTGFAFDPVRAGHAIRCLTAGLSAIHGVGVIHRDLTPGNVLCCGFGESEIFKISDFGLARPLGLKRTFQGVEVGTLGYAAPEQMLESETHVSEPADVFSFACVVYYLLTGEHYFEGNTPFDAYSQIKDKSRRGLAECATLSPEIGERPDACRAIDAALARATNMEAVDRPQTADQFAATIVPWLGEHPSGPRSSRRLMSTMLSLLPPSDLAGWSWIVRHRPREDLVIQSAAWDTDGHCFAFTPRGPLFWNGQAWLGARNALADLPRGMAFARRHEAGGWLVGGSGGTLAVCTTDGVRDLVQAPDREVEFLDGSGRIDDLIAAVGRRPGGPPALYALSGGRWMKPLPLDGVGHVSALLRVDDLRWIIAGRLLRGSGFAALYQPMLWELSAFDVPSVRSFVGGAGSLERELALIAGSDGVALRIDAGVQQHSVVHGNPDLTAAAIDVLDREWVASLGTLWTRDPRSSEAFRPAWSDESWSAPFVSLMADAGLVVGLTADGGIVEGRSLALDRRT
jgi:eukaryotic-like serine/threonine-protein kinase